MVSLQILSFHNRPNTFMSQLVQHSDDVFKKTRTYQSSSLIVHAAKKDSQQFEVDPDKAREALQNLDQQLQSLSQKQLKPPKPKAPDQQIAAPDVKFTRGQMTEKMPELDESFLAYSTVFLVIFTIFYNILFYAVIKPAIDLPEEVVPAKSTAAREASIQSLAK